MIKRTLKERRQLTHERKQARLDKRKQAQVENDAVRVSRDIVDDSEEASVDAQVDAIMEEARAPKTFPPLRPFNSKPSSLTLAVEFNAQYIPSDSYKMSAGEMFSPELEAAIEDDVDAQTCVFTDKDKRKRQALLDELEQAKQRPMGKAKKPLTEYEATLMSYHRHGEAAFKRWKKTGKVLKLPAGLADLFKAVMRHRAGGSGVLHHRALILGDTALLRKDSAATFDDLVLYIIANTDLSTRSFSLRGTQAQIAQVIGKSQATVSRWLARLIRWGALRHAFIGDNLATDPRAGIVHDKGDSAKRNLNNVYVLTDEFGPLMGGQTAGDKLNRAFEQADLIALQEGAGTLPARLAILRGTLWEGTIERRKLAISVTSTKKQLQHADDRSIAAKLIVKKMRKQGLELELSEKEFGLLLNVQLKHCGFSPGSPPPTAQFM